MELAEIKKALYEFLVLHRGTGTYKHFDRIHTMILRYEDSIRPVPEPEIVVAERPDNLGGRTRISMCCISLLEAVDDESIDIELRSGNHILSLHGRPILYCPFCGIKIIIK